MYYTKDMKYTIRRLLLIASLLLVVCGLLAIGFALWPLQNAQVIATLPPTVFAPP
jgi:uncharacterized membrane protein